MLLPSALGFSPHLPVSVYGTGTVQTIAAFLGSWLTHFPTSVRYASRLRIVTRICQRDSYLACHGIPFPLVLSLCVPTVLLYCSTGISTCCPSPTRLRLGLGPDLPWDDDRCPGTLRLSVEGILTLLFATHTGILSSCLSTCPSGQASPMQERSPTQLTNVNCQSFGSVL